MIRCFKIMALCGLVMMSIKAYTQNVETTYTGRYLTYIVNSSAKITLHASSADAAAYQWYQNGAAVAGALYKDFIATANGTYAVVAYNANGCSSKISDTVMVNFRTALAPVNKPDTAVDLMVTIKAGSSTELLGQKYLYTLTAKNNSSADGTQVQVKYNIPANLAYVDQSPAAGSVQYNGTTRTLVWTIDKLARSNPLNLDVTLDAVQPGLVQSRVTIQGTQADPNMINNSYVVQQQIDALAVPNVFTPNGDGLNDTFTIPGLSAYAQNDITIINRWGNEVYTKKNYNNDWTGDNLVEGTYFYVLRAQSSSGNWEVHKGYITLLRSHL